MSFISRNHPQQVSKRGAIDDVDDRRTPDDFFDPLNKIHGFTLDSAASKENKKCSKFFSINDDGLTKTWGGEVVWCNPPYSNILAWVKKAISETANDCKKVAMLLPANRCEQAWWQDYIEPRRDRGVGMSTLFLRGRMRFGHPKGWKTPPKGDRPPFGLVLIIIEGVR